MTPTDRTIHIIAETAGRDPHSIAPDHDLIMDVGLDSLDQLEMVMALEEEFGCEISDAEADGMRTVEDVCKAMEARHG